MPTLIVDQPGRRFGGRLNGRALIGRLPTNGIPLTDSSVSRLHAWIDTNASGRVFVADTGSLTGTWVNGTAVVKRQDLNNGDVVKVGKTQITFLEADALPAGIETVDLAGQPPGQNVEESGVLFDCPCGAPAWLKAASIGHNHQCRQCGRTIRVPERPNEVAEEVSPPPVIEPGVPPVGGQSAENPFLIHDASMGEVRGAHNEHGLADSGIHRAIPAEPEPSLQASPEELTLEQVLAPDPVLDQPEEPLHLPEVEPVAPEPEAAASVEAFHEPQVEPHPEEVFQPEPPAVLPPAPETHGHSDLEPYPESTLESELSSEAVPYAQPEAFVESEQEPEAVKPSLFERRTPAPDLATPLTEEEPLDLSTAEAPLTEIQNCGVCHHPVRIEDAQTVCPSCGVNFHAECWNENLGCSSYGCPQVNILKPPEPESTEPEMIEIATVDEDVPAATVPPEEAPGFPWEFVFLFANVIGVLLGALSYGVPPLIGLLGTIIYLGACQHSRRRRPVAWLALLLCVVGVGGGIYVSYVYWHGWPPIGPWARPATPHALTAGAKR